MPRAKAPVLGEAPEEQFTVRCYDQAGESMGESVEASILHMFIGEQGLRLCDAEDGSGHEFISIGSIASYDTGGSLGEAGMNSLILLLKAKWFGGARPPAPPSRLLCTGTL